jgi:hypothetical protein
LGAHVTAPLRYEDLPAALVECIARVALLRGGVWLEPDCVELHAVDTARLEPWPFPLDLVVQLEAAGCVYDGTRVRMFERDERPWHVWVWRRPEDP